MAVPRLDPRVTKDRVYEYGEYKVLSAQFGRRSKQRGIFGLGLPRLGQATRRPALRLTYGVLVGLGLAVLISCALLAVYFEADSLRLSYKQQDLQLALASLGQAQAEAEAKHLAAQRQVLTEGSVPEGVVYPAQTKYVVLTNIPAVSGATLVSSLYPLSRELIRIEP